ncbi:MAG: F0F1 ATP synthase subunit gamma, partial [Ignavibacteriaceae bacterium]
MATLRDIKNRIKGVQNTQQITKAMKMVAAAKLRRAQDKVINARPYAHKIADLFTHLVTDEDLNNPFLIEKDVKNIALVLVTADRGLCGAFNTNIIKEATGFIENDSQTASVHVFCVGKKGFDYFNKRDYDVVDKRTGLFSTLEYSSALNITNELIRMYLDSTFDKIIVVYNEFKSIIQQKIV